MPPDHGLKFKERKQSDVKNHPTAVPNPKTYNTVLKKSGDRFHHIAESQQSLDHFMEVRLEKLKSDTIILVNSIVE